MKDKQLIDNLGGPTAVARLLGFDLSTGARRVHNWTKRGIPAQVKLDHPHIFLAGTQSNGNRTEKAA